MQIVPLQAVPAQSVNIVLNGQPCVINVNARSAGGLTNLFLDLYVNGALVIGGVVGLQGVRIVRDSYLGFSGDLIWNGTTSDPINANAQDPVTPASDPYWQGLGGRFALLYLSPAELTGDV